MIQSNLVVEEFSQILEKDYNETFILTLHLNTLYMYLVIIANDDLDYSHFDIKNDFTNSHFEKEIYLMLPHSVHIQYSNGLHALRSQYALKQVERD
jgi:hypothetical protein